MAVRRRRLYPDTRIDTAAYGPVDYVSDSAFLEAVLAAAQTVALAGGVMTVVVDRHPTDLPQEMLTTSAVIEWKDRTNAKAQPEPMTELDRAVEPPPGSAPDIEPELVAEPIVDEVGDGLDPRTLEEEDLTSIPAGQR